MRKGRNEGIIEYVLRHTAKPTGITQYRLTEAPPEGAPQRVADERRPGPRVSAAFLTALRMVIERELRTIARSFGLDERAGEKPLGLGQLTRLLSAEGLLSPELAGRLDRIAKALNAAVHGLDIKREHANAAFDEAGELLRVIRDSRGKND